MPRLSLWNSGVKSADYKFIDRTISEAFHAGGTAVYVHKYLGPHDQGDTGDASQPNHIAKEGIISERSIQDVLYLENRDRKYENNVYELRGLYNVQDVDFDLRQFGLFLENDTLFLEFHLNDMVACIGRKLMPGDVLELPHLRDDTLLDPEAPAINKFYVVDDANRASEGYSVTWWPHIWRVKCKPMTASQEFEDILQQQATNPFGELTGGTLGELMSNIGVEMGINDAVVEQAKADVKARYFETRQFYVVPGEGGEGGSQDPWVYAGDGVPPNGAQLVGSGTKFPQSPSDGAYYLRTDYSPHVLFMFSAGAWRRQELDYRRGDWMAAARLLEEFVNNRSTTTYNDGTVADERTALSKAVKPKADL